MHRLDLSCSSAWTSLLRRIELYANKTKLWRFVAQPCATKSQTVSPCCVREFPLPSGASNGCCARSACKNRLYNDHGKQKHSFLQVQQWNGFGNTSKSMAVHSGLFS